MPRLHRVDNGRAFTLIELIVVVVVLSILAAVAIPAYFNMGGKARAAAYAYHSKLLVRIFRQYEIDNGYSTHPTFAIMVNANNVGTSGVATQLDANAFRAFEGTWTYTSEVQENESLGVFNRVSTVTGLVPMVGGDAAAGAELHKAFTGVSVNPSYDSVLESYSGGATSGNTIFWYNYYPPSNALSVSQSWSVQVY